MQEILDRSHVLMQHYLINSKTKITVFRARQIHAITSQVGNTDKEINDWINRERGSIEEIVDIKYTCTPSSHGTVTTKVYIDYIRNTDNNHPTTDIKVKEIAPSDAQLNIWLYEERNKIEVGEIRIVNLSAEMRDEYIAALIDYTTK
jgi:hypothetical protein